MWDQHTQIEAWRGEAPFPSAPPRAPWRLWHLLSGRVTTHLKEGTAGNTEGGGQCWALSLPSGDTDRPAGVGATRLYSKEPCEKGAGGPWTEPQAGSSAPQAVGLGPLGRNEDQELHPALYISHGEAQNPGMGNPRARKGLGPRACAFTIPLICHFPSHSCFHSYGCFIRTVRGLVSEGLSAASLRESC